MRNLLKVTAWSCAFVMQASMLRAEVTLPAIISDNMCLQANKPVPIWGRADPGEKVTVTLGEDRAGHGRPDGNWTVMLKPLQAGGGPAHEGRRQQHIDVKNIIVGEVWVASGQSNMEFGFNGAHNAAEERPKANYPKIRIFNLRRRSPSSRSGTASASGRSARRRPSITPPRSATSSAATCTRSSACPSA